MFWIALTLSIASTSTLTMPRLGLGTWGMGESPACRSQEVAAVRTAIGMGYRLIDTAEMYGEGGAEEVVGEALAQALCASEVQRDELFIVSKAYPHNARRPGRTGPPVSNADTQDATGHAVTSEAYSA